MTLYLTKHPYGYFVGVRHGSNLYCTVAHRWWNIPAAWVSSARRAWGWL